MILTFTSLELQTCFPNFQLNQKSRGQFAPLLPMAYVRGTLPNNLLIPTLGGGGEWNF